MTAIVVSIQPHGFSDYTKEPEEEDVDHSRPMISSPSTNDCLDDVPRSRYSLDGMEDDDNDNDNDNDTVGSSSSSSSSSSSTTSSIPSLNDAMEEHEQLLPVSSSSSSSFGGLNNLGNTCYLNSALQMVASLDDFLKQIKQFAPLEDSKFREALVNVWEKLDKGETIRPDDFKSQVDDRSSLFIGYRQQDSHEFLTALLDLLDEDYKKKDEEQQQEEDQNMQDAAGQGASSQEEEPVEAPQHEDDSMECSPVKKQRVEEDTDMKSNFKRTHSFKDLEFSDIESLLHGEKVLTKQTKVQKQQEPNCKLVGGRMSTSGVSLTPFESGDAEESSASWKISQEGNEDSVPPVPAKTNSPIDSYFTTEVRVCLTCDSCKYRRSHTETYLHLSLEIGQNCSSLEDGLRKFFAPEKRDIKCEKCFCVTAEQTTEITRLPRAMLFHLKRFIVDVSPDWTSISYRKDQSPVSYEEELFLDDHGVLNEFLAADVSLPRQGGKKYGIRSVVNHIGSSASCGHYTADAKRLYKGQREWSRFNDSMVSKISSTDAVENAARTAYMIMYEIEQD